MEKNCPTTMQFLVTLANENVDHLDEKRMPPICLLYALPMFFESTETSCLQRLTTILLAEGGAKKMASSTFKIKVMSFETNGRLQLR